jgi:hypothetical protein
LVPGRNASRVFEMQEDDGACRPRWATPLAKLCSLFIILSAVSKPRRN